MTTEPRRVILVTGAPRTATTPVGNVLASCRGAVSLYEPFGPTGLAAIADRFPMLGGPDGVADAVLSRAISDFSHLRLPRLGSQQRPGPEFSWKRSVFGSRTLHSFRMARLRPWSHVVIWKDPHAVMMAHAIPGFGPEVVVTARRARPHAASYRRLGWVSQAPAVYPRWSQRFGRCALIEGALDRASDPVVSAALIWRMCYLPLVSTGAMDRIHLVTADDLIADEAGTYDRLFAALGLRPGRRTGALLNRRTGGRGAVPDAGVTHDWSRSVADVNAYWKDLLTPEELAAVDALTADVEEALFAAGHVPAGDTG